MVLPKCLRVILWLWWAMASSCPFDLGSSNLRNRRMRGEGSFMSWSNWLAKLTWQKSTVCASLSKAFLKRTLPVLMKTAQIPATLWLTQPTFLLRGSKSMDRSNFPMTWSSMEKSMGKFPLIREKSPSPKMLQLRVMWKQVAGGALKRCSSECSFFCCEEKGLDGWPDVFASGYRCYLSLLLVLCLW